MAAKKRSRRHLTETDEYVSGNNEGMLLDAITVSTAYGKMKSLCLNIRNEIFTDIEIDHQDILPRYLFPLMFGVFRPFFGFNVYASPATQYFINVQYLRSDDS